MPPGDGADHRQKGTTLYVAADSGLSFNSFFCSSIGNDCLAVSRSLTDGGCCSAAR